MSYLPHISYIPIAILAYALNGGAIIVDKILLRTSLPNPLVYTFYISLLGILTVFLIPLGLKLNTTAVIFSIISGLFGTFAFLTFFKGLKLGEVSVVGPVVGALNPLFTLIFGIVLFNQILTSSQLTAFFLLLIGAVILTFNIWANKLKFSEQLFMMVLSGIFFAAASLFLKEAFLSSNFITGLVISRVAAALFVLLFLIPKNLRSQIFSSKLATNNFLNKTSILLLSGQTMGALFGLLWAYTISLTSPAVVNSLFGIQYLVILGAALILGKNHPKLLDETLSFGVITQKIIGAAILSFGVYLLSR